MACPGPEFLGRYESLSAASSLNNRLKSGRCRRFRRRPTAPGDHQSGLVLKRSPAQAAWPSLTDGRSKWSRSLPLRARSFFSRCSSASCKKLSFTTFFHRRFGHLEMILNQKYELQMFRRVEKINATVNYCHQKQTSVILDFKFKLQLRQPGLLKL